MYRSSCAAAVAFCSLLSSATAQLLGPPSTIDLGNPDGIELVRLVDLNGDGKLDVVVAGLGSNALALLGDGQGGLGAPIASSTPVGLVADVRVLDFTGDGRVDLAIAGVGGQHLLTGDGTGTFAAAAPLPLSPRGVADWNGDGNIDLVAANGQLLVAFGNGDGTFGAPTSVPLPPDLVLPFLGITAAVAGDLDGDGDKDLVVGGFFGGTTFVFGDGLGNVVRGYSLVQPLSAQLVTPQALVDVDHDGDLDLFAREGLGGLRLARNDGNGLFTSSTPIAGAGGGGGQVGGGTGRFAAVDMDGDGHVDLVTSSSPDVLVQRGDGMGGFAPPAAFFAGPHDRLAVGDLDRDGRPDVVAAGAGFVHVLRNQLPSLPGLAAYGLGTPTCDGTIGMQGRPRPAIGDSTFRVLCSNAPPDAVGLLAMGTRVTNGWTPAGLGLTLHLGLAFPVASMRSDTGGVASARLPIPAMPWLVGLQVHVQSFWIGDAGRGNTCSPAFGELASSRGLSITLQP